MTRLAAYLIYSKKNTESAIKAECTFPMLRALGGEVPPELLAHCCFPQQCMQLQPLACPAYLTWLLALCCTDLESIFFLHRVLRVAFQCYSILLQLSPLAWAPRPCSQPHLPLHEWKLLALYLCNHLLVTGRNSVLHRSFSQ